jgi:hypothetical protein
MNEITNREEKLCRQKTVHRKQLSQRKRDNFFGGKYIALHLSCPGKMLKAKRFVVKAIF